jgi:cysteinyl-tRNA synthetase
MTTIETNREEQGVQRVASNIRIYNTLSRSKEPLHPVVSGKVGIYLCGPTVYDKAHIGHMVGPVIFDTIKRFLTYSGYEVTWVVNITDVDDKLIHKANERSISMAEVAEENIADYSKNLQGMGVDQIDQMPRATESMEDIIEMTATLIEQGFAYAVEGDVFFDVGKDQEYGKLTNRTLKDIQGEGGQAAVKKRSVADFALWKSAKPGEPSWESPWGEGRPGWHIECSAMSRGLLGETFDIHGGGLDLVFPHHENEIAQSECCHGKPMAQIWMHNGLLRAQSQAGKIGGRGEREASAGSEKMSRSKGADGLADLIEQQGGERIRFFLLRTHYRSTVLFGPEAIREAATGLETFYRFFKRYERITGTSFYEVPAADSRCAECAEVSSNVVDGGKSVAQLRQRFLDSMDDDFNTGGAIGDLFELVRLLNKQIEEQQLEHPATRTEDALVQLTRGVSVLRELSRTLGLFIQPVANTGVDQSGSVLGDVLQLIIRLRAEARAAKKFEVADKIRDALAEWKIVLEDRADATDWVLDGDPERALAGLVTLLIELRNTARSEKDFAVADNIRDSLATARIILEDRADGTEWSVEAG